MKKETKNDACPLRLRASRDALEIIQGKWRIPIVISLTYGVKTLWRNTKRYWRCVAKNVVAGIKSVRRK